HSGPPRTPASEARRVPPAPTPTVSRPPLTWSIVLTACAVGTGCRKFGEVTIVPSRIREVTAAAALSVVYASYQGVEPRHAMWSYTQACRNPRSSARRHRSPASGHDRVGQMTVPILGVVTVPPYPSPRPAGSARRI